MPLTFTRGEVVFSAHASLGIGGPTVRISRLYVVENAHDREDVVVRTVLEDGSVKGHHGQRVTAPELHRSIGEAANAALETLRREYQGAILAMARAIEAAEKLPPVKS